MRSRTAAVSALLLLTLGVLALAARVPRAVADLFASPGRTRLDHGVVLERVRTVAKLVTTELTLRDVVIYENTWFGSTKRSLVVVTGAALVGFDLQSGARVTVDDAGRLLRITLPRAEVVSVDIRGFTTYDEHRGLWNAFRPADRDTIYQQARAQFVRSAREQAVLARAEAAAREILTAMFAPAGYRVEVVFEPFISPSPPE